MDTQPPPSLPPSWRPDLLLPTHRGFRDAPLQIGPGVGQEGDKRGRGQGWAGGGHTDPVPRAPCPRRPAGAPGALCPTARSLPVDDLVVSKFEQSVQGANMTEDHTLYFPKYGFCEAADQFHVLDEVKR